MMICILMKKPKLAQIESDFFFAFRWSEWVCVCALKKGEKTLKTKLFVDATRRDGNVLGHECMINDHDMDS